MSYNFDFSVSAEITEKVVEEMIRKVVEEQTGKKVARLEFKFKSVTRGPQDDGWTGEIFKGCTVYFENERNLALRGSAFKSNTYGDR